MKVLLGVQARSASTRLPGKIYENIGSKPLLKWVYDAAAEAERRLRAHQIEAEAKVLGPQFDVTLTDWVRNNSIVAEFPKVKEDDLIQRYLQAMYAGQYTHVVRITADCPFHEPEMIVELVGLLRNCDYISNTCVRTWIEGLDLQGASLKGLEWVNENQTEKREHPFFDLDQNEIVRRDFEKRLKIIHLLNPENRWLVKGTSIDTKEDLERARKYVEIKERSNVDRTLVKRVSPGEARNVIQALEPVR